MLISVTGNSEKCLREIKKISGKSYREIVKDSLVFSKEYLEEKYKKENETLSK